MLYTWSTSTQPGAGVIHLVHTEELTDFAHLEATTGRASVEARGIGTLCNNVISRGVVSKDLPIGDDCTRCLKYADQRALAKS